MVMQVWAEKGLATRQVRNGLKREVFDQPLIDGARHLGLVLQARPVCLDRLLLSEVLYWPRNMQRGRVRKLLRAAGISEWALIGRLTDRQHLAIVAELVTFRRIP